MDITQYATPTMIMLVIVLIVSLALYSKLIQAVSALVMLLRDLQGDIETVRRHIANVEKASAKDRANILARLDPDPAPAARKPRVQRKKM